MFGFWIRSSAETKAMLAEPLSCFRHESRGLALGASVSQASILEEFHR